MATFSIAASLDDAKNAGGINAAVAIEVTFGEGSTNGYLRWSIDIPDGSTIDDAKITFHSWANDADVFTAKIGLLDFDSCPNFADGNNPWTMAVTVNPAEVDYSPPQWVDNGNYDSSEIKTLVQGFIDRVGYSVNNYIGIRLHLGDSAKGEHRKFDSKDQVGGVVAVLTVNYTPPAVAWVPKVIMVD